MAEVFQVVNRKILSLLFIEFRCYSNRYRNFNNKIASLTGG